MEILGQNIMTFPGIGMTGSAYSTTSDYFNNLLDSDLRRPFRTIDFDSDAATFVFIASFTSYQVVDRIAIMGHNLKQFQVEWIGNTSGGIGGILTLNEGSGTNTAQWTMNSLTSNYLMFDPLTCLQIIIRMTKTMVANQDKTVGYLSVCKSQLTLSQKPGYSGYSLVTKDKSISHEMANGGYRYQTLAQKMSAKLEMEYVPASLRASLYDLYYNRQEMMFVPNPPTTTASTWDQQIFPCVWSNGFDFETYSDNSSTPYYSGTIELDEVPK